MTNEEIIRSELEVCRDFFTGFTCTCDPEVGLTCEPCARAIDIRRALQALNLLADEIRRECESKRIDQSTDPVFGAVRRKQLASLQSDIDTYQETSPGVWQTQSQSCAEAAWKDMIAAGEHGPKAQEKMIETLAEHFLSYSDEIRKECADRAGRWFYNSIASLEAIELEGFLQPLRVKQIATLKAAIMGKEAGE